MYDRYAGARALDGRPHGRGVMWFAAGDLYAGEWFAGVPHGYGVWWSRARDQVYEGYWCAGARHGLGTQSSESGAIVAQGGWTRGACDGTFLVTRVRERTTRVETFAGGRLITTAVSPYMAPHSLRTLEARTPMAVVVR